MSSWATSGRKRDPARQVDRCFSRHTQIHQYSNLMVLCSTEFRTRALENPLYRLSPRQLNPPSPHFVTILSQLARMGAGRVAQASWAISAVISLLRAPSTVLPLVWSRTAPRTNLHCAHCAASSWMASRTRVTCGEFQTVEVPTKNRWPRFGLRQLTGLG